jgi:DNA polymerase III subunit gamma/tau
MIKLFENNGEVLVAAHLYQDIACIALKKGHFEFKAYPNAPKDLAGRVRTCLKQWTGDNWMVSVVAHGHDDALSLAKKRHHEKESEANSLMNNPNIKAALNVFPDAKIVKIFKVNDDV